MSKESFDISVKRFDEFAAQYADRFNTIDAYLPSIDQFCNLIEVKNPSILELACGPGNITKYLKQKFPDSKIIALDLAPKMISIARNQVKGVDFRVMDIRDISSLPNKFDAIMCSFGLPFLSVTDAAKLITDCAKLMNTNGVIYISTMEGDETKAGFEPTSFSGDSKVFFNYHRQADIENAMIQNSLVLQAIKRQEYLEADGSVLIDMIFIGTKR
jgi:ubiquinone/menaquinone biosynthesis C-methylase UbiE